MHTGQCMTRKTKSCYCGRCVHDVGMCTQVFRTYNASIVLDGLLNKDSDAVTVDERMAEYNRANKEARAPACMPPSIHHYFAWIHP